MGSKLNARRKVGQAPRPKEPVDVETEGKLSNMDKTMSDIPIRHANSQLR